MKKSKYLILIGLTIIFIYVLSKFINLDYQKVNLPNTNELIKIELIDNYDIVIHSIKFQMTDFINSIKKNTKYTDIQSIGDIPITTDNFIVIKFYHNSGDDVKSSSIAYIYIYIYEKDNKKYFEQPFVGIWELSEDIYYKILNKNFN